MISADIFAFLVVFIKTYFTISQHTDFLRNFSSKNS